MSTSFGKAVKFYLNGNYKFGLKRAVRADGVVLTICSNIYYEVNPDHSVVNPKGYTEKGLSKEWRDLIQAQANQPAGLAAGALDDPMLTAAPAPAAQEAPPAATAPAEEPATVPVVPVVEPAIPEGTPAIQEEIEEGPVPAIAEPASEEVPPFAEAEASEEVPVAPGPVPGSQELGDEPVFDFEEREGIHAEEPAPAGGNDLAIAPTAELLPSAEEIAEEIVAPEEEPMVPESGATEVTPEVAPEVAPTEDIVAPPTEEQAPEAVASPAISEEPIIEKKETAPMTQETKTPQTPQKEVPKPTRRAVEPVSDVPSPFEFDCPDCKEHFSRTIIPSAEEKGQWDMKEGRKTKTVPSAFIESCPNCGAVFAVKIQPVVIYNAQIATFSK